MKTHLFIRYNTYRDSMVMMKFQSFLEKTPGVVSCAAIMATPTNKEHLKKLHLLTTEIDALSPNDLCIAVEAELDDEALRAIQEKINQFLDNPKTFDKQQPGEIRTRSLKSALKILPGANIAQISVPGEYATYETMNALDHDLNVFLFSDNVPIQDEVEIKARAEKRGLIVMGPDCGTAIISGVGFGFYNQVRRGKIGLIGASGTGLQEVSCLIYKLGEGLSQVIGTGGRDLMSPVSGKTFTRALDFLAGDPETETVALISKKYSPEAVQTILRQAATIQKPVVAYFPGIDPAAVRSPNIHYAAHLEHAAVSAVELLHGRAQPLPLDRDNVYDRRGAIIQSECAKFSSRQRYIKALLTGGSFADQANMVLSGFVSPLYSYPADERTVAIDDPLTSREDSVIDLGADIFTQGRVHPMINPGDRNNRILAELKDDRVKVLLLDVVLGYGAHPDPAGDLSNVIREAKDSFEKKGGYLSCVVFICGTQDDIQNLAEQKKKLEACGAIVTESSSEAAYITGLIGMNGRG
jgi:FdrA protein